MTSVEYERTNDDIMKIVVKNRRQGNEFPDSGEYDSRLKTEEDLYTINDADFL